MEVTGEIGALTNGVKRRIRKAQSRFARGDRLLIHESRKACPGRSRAAGATHVNHTGTVVSVKQNAAGDRRHVRRVSSPIAEI